MMYRYMYMYLILFSPMVKKQSLFRSNSTQIMLSVYALVYTIGQNGCQIRIRTLHKKVKDILKFSTCFVLFRELALVLLF